MSQEEKDKRTVLGLICAIIILIVIIILVSCNYGKNDTKDVKKKEDPTIIETKDGEEIDAVEDAFASFSYAHPLSFVETSKKESKAKEKIVLSEEIEKVSALSLVEIAEKTYDIKDVEAARKAVNELTDEIEKEMLNARLDMVEKFIDVENIISSFEEKTITIETKEIFDSIVSEYATLNTNDMLKDLTENSKKEELITRIEKLETLLFDNISPTVTEPINSTYYNRDVVITASDENEIKLLLNKNEISNNKVVTEEGRYTLVVTDKAFNQKTVLFAIDKTAPVVSLNGENTEILVGNDYTEEGVTATDNIDGKISTYTTKIVNNETTEEVEVIDTSKVGSYTVYYEVTDKAGNVGNASRVVTITDEALYYAFDNEEMKALSTDNYNDAYLTLNNNNILKVKTLLTKEQKENNATVGITLQTKLGNYSFNNIGEEIYSIDLANYPGLEEIIFFVDADGYQYDKTTTINITNPTEATFNADKYVGEYTALVNGEYLTIKIVKNTDGTYKAMLPKAVAYKTDTEYWTDFNADRISFVDGSSHVYIHASHSVEFIFDEAAGTLTALTDGKYITNSSETFMNYSTVFTKGVVFSKYVKPVTTTNIKTADVNKQVDGNNVTNNIDTKEENIKTEEVVETEINEEVLIQEEKQVQEELVVSTENTEEIIEE